MSSSIALFLCLGCALLFAPAQAQETLSALLSKPDLGAFPQVSLFLDVHDSQGQFVHGLQVEQVQIIENDVTLPVTTIQEITPGAQVVVAINPGPAMGVRNSKGISRYDYVIIALTDWARGRQGSSLDDWSLVITNGPEINHVSDPIQWLEALEEDQTNSRTSEPNLDTLFRAVNLAADTPPRPGMGRAVLFISPPLEGELNQPLDNLIAQANQNNVNIFIWAVSSAGDFPTAGMQNLTNLAQQTGGQMLLYSGEEELPNPEQYIAPLRWIYNLSYQSAINTAGAHQVKARVQSGELAIESPAQSFEINLQPPKPTFVSPPLQIERRLPSASPPEDSGNVDNHDNNRQSQLLPVEHPVQVIFDFTDEHPRPIVQAALYVDGILVDENLETPFDRFTWNIESYLTSGTHIIQVQATDSLGLTGASIELPIAINVENAASNPWLTIQRSLPVITVLLVVLAGAVLLLALLVGGQLRPATLRAAGNKRQKSDPVTQPVPIPEDASARQGVNWANRLHWPQRHIPSKALAFLSRIGDSGGEDADDQSTTGRLPSPIPITADEITLGSNPNLATLLLDDPSIEGLHARLVRLEDGAFRLSDEGSVAGTWVNYSPVSQSGTQLIHGDLIHVGRIGFRFTLRQPTQVRKPVITFEGMHDPGTQPEGESTP